METKNKYINFLHKEKNKKIKELKDSKNEPVKFTTIELIDDPNNERNLTCTKCKQVCHKDCDCLWGIPIIRPVACLDKLEIIDISKKIDTYNISILPYEDCCTIFVPKHPVINPRSDKCIEIEKKIDYESMIDDIISETFVIKINNKKDYNDLL